MKLLSGNLYGDVLENTTVAGLRLTETSYAPALRLPPHSHELAYFCFVLTGNFTETYAKLSRSCKSSTLVFHPADETHSDYFHAASRCFNIQIGSEWLAAARQGVRVLDAPIDFQGGSTAALAQRLYREFRQSDEFSPLVIEALTLEILVEASRRFARKSSPTVPRWLRQAQELIREQPCEYLTLTGIANQVGVHPVHLARQFSRHFHCTVGDYIRRCRIETAAQKLARTDLPIVEIALQVGFFDQSHFARTFKQQTGFTPAQYRTAFRQR